MYKRQLKTGVHADLLSFKTQIRGFYCDRTVTFKVSRPGSGMSSRNVANEAAIRLRLKDTDRVGVPAMQVHGAIGSGYFIVEELFADRETMTHRGRLPTDAGGALFDFYRANEFALVPLNGVMDAGRELAMLDAHARNLGFVVPDGTVAFVQREILEADDKVLDGIDVHNAGEHLEFVPLWVHEPDGFEIDLGLAEVEEDHRA